MTHISDAHVSDAPHNPWRATYPFIPLSLALALLRIGVAALFMAHAIVRVLTPGSLDQFVRFMTSTGVPYGRAVVVALTAFEVLGGIMLMLGRRTRIVGSGFCVILLTGIALIHRHLGWFVGEHGTGGSEYSVALLLALLVIMAADAHSSAHADRQSPNAS